MAFRISSSNSTANRPEATPAARSAACPPSTPRSRSKRKWKSLCSIALRAMIEPRNLRDAVEFHFPRTCKAESLPGVRMLRWGCRRPLLERNEQQRQDSRNREHHHGDEEVD